MVNSSLCDALVAELKPLLDTAGVECALLAGEHVALTADASPDEISGTFRDAGLLIVAGSSRLEANAVAEEYQYPIVEIVRGHNLYGGVRIVPTKDFYKWGGESGYFGSGVPVKEIYSRKAEYAV